MSGLLRRLTRRPATADEHRSPTDASGPAATSATAGGTPPLPGGDDQPTQVLDETSDPATREWAVGPTGWSGARPQAAPAAAMATVPIAGQFPERPPEKNQAVPAPGRDLPAGVDPAALADAPESARRGRLRRRLRYLRSVRELLLRDLGGLTYEIQRAGSREEAHRELQQTKADRIVKLDAEVRALEARLGEPHPQTTLREAGIGGTCPECGELHASDAHFCSRCGTPLDAGAARATRPAEPRESRSGSLWAGLRGRRAPEPEPAADKPAAVTGEWLGAGDQPTTFDRPAPVEGADEPAAAPQEGEPVTSAGGEPATPVEGEPVTSAEGEPMTPAEGEPVTSAEGRREER